MDRVMIVDDERLIREGLRGLIDWGASGFEVVALASDGQEALDLQAQNPVDLIIADIRMPRMDGLALLSALRSRGDSCRFLILSGFAEFEYAQKAAALQIDGYLLKPVDEEILVRHLEQVRAHLGTQVTVPGLLEGTSRIPPAWDWGAWQVLMVSLCTPSGQPLVPSSETEARMVRACRDGNWGEAFVHHGFYGVLLKQVYPGGHNLGRLTRVLEQALGPEVPLFAAAVGPVVSRPADIAESARQARALLANRFFLPPGTIVWANRPSADPGPLPDCEALAEKLGLALEVGDLGNLRSTVGIILQALARTGSEATVKDACLRVVSGAIEGYLGHESRSSVLRARNTSWVSGLWKHPFLATLEEFLVQELETLVGRERCADSTNLVRKMQDLIELRYAENLKLETLADVFHYNSAYLGKLFRSKTGEYFNAYLDRVRVRKAQELLLQGLKVYQVAELVGYKYVDYFHSKFKKLTGLSPSQFRGGESCPPNG